MNKTLEICGITAFGSGLAGAGAAMLGIDGLASVIIGSAALGVSLVKLLRD